MTADQQHHLEWVLSHVRMMMGTGAPGQMVIHFDARGIPVKVCPAPVYAAPKPGRLARESG